MKTSRSDIKRDRRQTICPNSSTLGYSGRKLRYGDLFVYREHYIVGGSGLRLAKCHGRVMPLGKIDESDKLQWFILAQAASNNMQFTYERWVEPEDVEEVLPGRHANKHILAFFEEGEE